ncbi:DUF2170 family protein [Marinomonas mediterranea]|jgi:Uncharacterized protein conserved in bacteria|uniref:Cytoplasmic protein n=1 Tax=Marinomonas mediterranea (strain ATCC 700492 / JCM 21426 / NBRC 103028 / MMB-1) TaxID=717774 RepID=F2K3P9_MARM1|nr:DUF2170 family protein [Marinomonas mediterranea]ADZ92488.1 Protein of unknown function DUF2170 [Marinomonas mediterranea MMB-1]WCN10434.1 DUF2170 family protein [Marinomonas mediterranea]WCN14482.1 DUF2170 family protein [Marinomonas mediterranea]WCN18533.1 DUF2170 family protein [Marinomonas mediterranea MMB-1]
MSWNKDTLLTLIEAQPNWVVEPEGECLNISNDEGIDVFVYVGNQQILVETALFSAANVKDKDRLNNLILRSHQLVPLTSICIKNIGDDEYYIAFGALSIDSKESVVLEEIETLFNNVSEFLELYSDDLNMEIVL